VGDKIITINDNLAKDLDLSQINGYFDTRPGKRIKINLQRNFKYIKTEFLLVNEI